MTDNIVDTWRDMLPLRSGIPWRKKERPAATLRALQWLLSVCLIVAIGGCVNTKPGDFNAPEPPAERRPF
jgi:hypothetical protein